MWSHINKVVNRDSALGAVRIVLGPGSGGSPLRVPTLNSDQFAICIDVSVRESLVKMAIYMNECPLMIVGPSRWELNRSPAG